MPSIGRQGYATMQNYCENGRMEWKKCAQNHRVSQNLAPVIEV